MRKTCGQAVQELLAGVCIGSDLSPAQQTTAPSRVGKAGRYTHSRALFVLNFTRPILSNITSVFSQFYTVSTVPTIKFCQ